MWEDWKKAWQDAVQNFEREMAAPDEDYASPAHRASAMHNDLSAARAALARLEADLLQARKDVAGEEEQESTARRRAEMAGRINDEETIRIANEFAERHAHRAGILRRKVEVLQDELNMRQEELSVMEQQAEAEVGQMPKPRSAEELLQRDRDDFNFRKLDRERKEREAEARLEEMKKKLGM